MWLVAHSMGGLICRSMIQKVCPDNGIDFSVLGLNIGVPQIAPFDAQVFNRKVMYQYLTPAAQLQQAPDMPSGWDAHVITGLDPSRVFCLIGTNALWAAWETAISQVTSVPDPIVPQPLSPDAPGSLSFTIPLPPAGRQLLGPRAAITLNAELLG